VRSGVFIGGNAYFLDITPQDSIICWLLDYKSFKNESEPYNILNDKLQKVMGITECITAHEVSLVLSMDRMHCKNLQL
jgi:hypothetical protein